MGSTGQGQVFADTCLICSRQCFIHSHYPDNKLTASRKKRSNTEPTPLEIRQSLYKAFEIGVKPEDVAGLSTIGTSSFDLPLCGSCVFKVGQLRAIQTHLTSLERQYDRLREEIAFSIVDVVASNLNSSVCSNISDQPAAIVLKKLQEEEVGTIQQLVFEKWHESSYTDFDEDEDDSQVDVEHGSNLKINVKVPSQESRKLSTSSVTVTSTDASSMSNGAISITKVESTGNNNLAYENGQVEILEADEYSQFAGDLYCEDDEDVESSPIDDELALEDEDFDAEDVDSDVMGFPFGLELAEYSSAMQKPAEEYEATEDHEVEDGRRGSDANQNLEVFRDHDGLYECQFCQKKFIHKYPFRDHLRVHFGDGPRCKICNKIFPKKHNLMLHLRTHSGEKPYVCTVCDKGFADKSNLKVHMRVHTGERPYKCEYCHVAFSNSSRLVVHKRTHTGEKPFTCEICNRKCTTRNQLSTHRKTHFQSGRNRLGRKQK